ncbi:MAG: DUF3500 domain-containing protein [Planctomycetes bacterium]|nr:DUF3500 domain-containing protein [Planctomycetota bacterium]
MASHAVRGKSARGDRRFPAVIRTLLLTTCSTLGAVAWLAQREPTPMRAAAQALVAALDREDRARAVFPFHCAQRLDWHYVPRERAGVPLRSLDERERGALRALLRTVLSAEGERVVDEIVALESVLKERESTPERPATWRDAEAYSVAIFGDVDSGDPWGWRFEGHHVVLQFSEVDGKLAFTPHFLGTNPARHEVGGRVVEPLAGEQSLARELAAAFQGTLARRSRGLGAVPADVVHGPGRDERFDATEGVALAELPEALRGRVADLLGTYVGRFDGPARARASELVADLGAVRFLWVGSTEAGKPHYYRLHSPRFTLEYHNGQNDVNHVHTLWRERAGDFGVSDTATSDGR